MSSVKTLPKIIYGTAWKTDSTLVVSAVLQGFRAIDTANQPKHYREDLVGEALQVLQEKHGITREQIWLQTKFTSMRGQDKTKPLPYDPTKLIKEQVLQSFQQSLVNLKTVYLDSYVLHSPLPTLSETLEAWSVLMSLQDEGKVRMIGISNTYDVPLLEALSEKRMVQIVQNRWYEGNGWDKEVVQYCKNHGIMYQSFWTLTGSPHLCRHPSVKLVASKLGRTPAQVIYRLAQLGGVTPLAGSKNEGRMKDGVDVENIDLSEASLQDDLKPLKELVFGH